MALVARLPYFICLSKVTWYDTAPGATTALGAIEVPVTRGAIASTVNVPEKAVSGAPWASVSAPAAMLIVCGPLPAAVGKAKVNVEPSTIPTPVAPTLSTLKTPGCKLLSWRAALKLTVKAVGPVRRTAPLGGLVAVTRNGGSVRVLPLTRRTYSPLVAAVVLDETST